MSKGKGKSTDTEEPEGTESEQKTSPPDPAECAHILHLSDLHFGAGPDGDPGADAKRWYGQLADDLIGELSCQRLDGLVVSGDIGNFSEPGEYSAAEWFIKTLCGKFGLEAGQVVIVPGNHDLNWKLSKKGYLLLDEEDHAGPLREERFIRVNNDVIRLRDDTAYPLRFRNFCKFYKTVTGASYPEDPTKQITLNHLPDLNLVIVGFNSCWEVDHHFTRRVSINPDALAYALEQLREEAAFRECLKFAVWHHPLDSQDDDRIRDRGFMQWLASSGFSVCLHGHIHKADSGLYRYDMSVDGRRINVVGAGTFGAPAKEWPPGYPLQYNLLRLSENTLRVITRRRIEQNGTWEPDHLWRQGKGNSNLPYYDIRLKKTEGTPKFIPSERSQTKTPDPVLENEISAYCRKVEALHEKLPLIGFKTNLRVIIDIADIYVPLRAMVDLRATGQSCYADSEDAEKCLRAHGKDCEISIPDAFREAEKMARPRRGIVILGDPGSGKTTHLKRVLLWCLRGGPVQLGLPENMIPVFLPFRELHGPDSRLDDFIQEQLGDPLLNTPEGFGSRLLERGNLLFLLDGLDEVADPDQRRQVSRWVEKALKIYPDCRFVVTCRFAGYTDEARLDADFLEMHLRPMEEKQAEAFIRNWYRIVETGLASEKGQAELLATKKADELIGRLGEPDFRSQRVFEMTRNPLLLTNICLVHQSRGNLPHTRSMLYEECLDVLLEKWRGAIGYQPRVMAQTGRRVLQPAAYWLHQEEKRTRASATELSAVIEPALKAVNWSDGSAADFLRAVRDESGLLTGWSHEQYGFIHLGFQEYLAAREIQRLYFSELGKTDVLKQLAAKFGQGWWQEVILLLLARGGDSCLFEPFMREVVRQAGFLEHSGLFEMCLDETAERTAMPFLELLTLDPAGNPDRLWERQLAALRIVELLDRESLEHLSAALRSHPYDKIRQWMNTRFAEDMPEVFKSSLCGYEMVRIPGGDFLMGSPDVEDGRYKDEGPQHVVTVADFYMGRYPVTNEEYSRFLEEHKGTKEPEFWGDRKFSQSGQPVVGVSWHDAKKYAEWAGLELPTEAQWEYACRAGTTTRFHTGNANADLDRAGWYEKNSGGRLHAVGEKEPNAFGLFDMHGNVWEWCEDHYHDSYKDAPSDGTAWVDQGEGSSRVLRGGSWDDSAGFCRSAYRFGGGPGDRILIFGFRLVFLPGQPKKKTGQVKGLERNGG